MKNEIFEQIETIRKFIINNKEINYTNPNFKNFLKSIALLQKENGSFDLLNRKQIRNDMIAYYCDEITYICTSLYIEAFLKEKNWFQENIGINLLKKALQVCSKYNLYGYSYYGLEIQLSNMKQFINHGLKELINRYNYINKNFTKMINEIINEYNNRIKTTNYFNGFGSYENEIKDVIFQYEN